MPQLSAGKKSMRSDARKRVYNLRRSRMMKDVTKELRELLKDGKTKEAADQMPAAYKAIDKAAKRGVIKKNTAARRKSRLAKLLAGATK